MCFKAKRLYQLALGPVLSLLGLISGAAWSDDSKINEINMPVGVTEVGAAIYDLHMTIFWICVVIGVAVFGVMFYSIFAHRKSRGVTPSHFHESTQVEVAWTVVPFLILLVMAVPATTTMIEVYDTTEADMDILVTGYQWKWRYEYLNDSGDNLVFFSMRPRVSLRPTCGSVAGVGREVETALPARDAARRRSNRCSA